jgi:hypothetical protein
MNSKNAVAVVVCFMVAFSCLGAGIGQLLKSTFFEEARALAVIDLASEDEIFSDSSNVERYEQGLVVGIILQNMVSIENSDLYSPDKLKTRILKGADELELSITGEDPEIALESLNKYANSILDKLVDSKREMATTLDAERRAAALSLQSLEKDVLKLASILVQNALEKQAVGALTYQDLRRVTESVLEVKEIIPFNLPRLEALAGTAVDQSALIHMTDLELEILLPKFISEPYLSNAAFHPPFVLVAFGALLGLLLGFILGTALVVSLRHNLGAELSGKNSEI